MHVFVDSKFPTYYKFTVTKLCSYKRACRHVLICALFQNVTHTAQVAAVYKALANVTADATVATH